MEQVRPRRAALFLRISTDLQNCESQRHDLLQLARARGFEVVNVHEEVISGAAPASDRPEFMKMKLSAHRGEFDVLLVWSLDRLGRRGMSDALQTVIDLDEAGVQVVSFREPWVVMQGPVRDLLIGIFGWVAAQERAQLVARTRAGLERARRQGKLIGRPRAAFNVEHAASLRASGLSIRQVAKKLGVGASTLCRALRARDVIRGREQTAA